MGRREREGKRREEYHVEGRLWEGEGERGRGGTACQEKVEGREKVREKKDGKNIGRGDWGKREKGD